MPSDGHVTTCDTLLETLKSLHDTKVLTWRKIAKIPPFAPLPPGTLCTWYKTGKLPRRWHKHFGLPVYAPAPVCAVHGVVHCYDCETQTPRPIRKPGKPRPRRAINLEDHDSAASTIVSHMDWDRIPKLIARLKELTKIP